MSKQNGPFFWWKEDEDDIHTCVFQHLAFLTKEQSYISTNNIRNMRLYGDFQQASPFMFADFPNEASAGTRNRVTFNVVQSMIDTVVSKITKNKPKATFLTEGGNFTLQSRAKKLTQFVEGQFFANKFYTKAAMAFQDAGIFGTGAVKIFKQGTEVKTERVFIDEIIVDDAEALYGEPRQMHQRKWIHRDTLTNMFPDKRGSIETAGSQPFQSGFVHGTPTSFRTEKNSDLVLVIESWHLPTGKTTDEKGNPIDHDGKHSITIENETLFVEPWTKKYFPFVFWRWGLRPIGFWGRGIAEELTGIQIEMNKILRTIQVSMHLISIPKIFLEASSKIVDAHLNNKIGGVITYAGKKPEEGPLGRIPPELFAHLDRLYGRAFEIVGISQLSATSQKPAGLDSGKALREFNDIETERFMSVGLRYQDAFIEAAKIMIDISKDIAKDTEDFKINVAGDKFLETIEWKDVDMAEDKYMMNIFPTSALSSTPAGKLQDVQELLEAGFISKDEGLKLLDFPDLRSFYNLSNASSEDIDRQIELMAEKGKYETPEPYQDLETGIVKMQQAYLFLRSQNAPESRLELFRRWIEDANALLIKSQAPPPIEDLPPADVPPPPIEGAPPLIPPPALASVPTPETLPPNLLPPPTGTEEV